MVCTTILNVKDEITRSSNYRIEILNNADSNIILIPDVFFVKQFSSNYRYNKTVNKTEDKQQSRSTNSAASQYQVL